MGKCNGIDKVDQKLNSNYQMTAFIAFSPLYFTEHLILKKNEEEKIFTTTTIASTTTT